MLDRGCIRKGVKSLKIKDFAESKGLTKQAIYKAVNRAGLSARQLTDNRGNITRKGSQVLSKLFPADQRGSPLDELPDQQQDDQQELISGLRDQIRELEIRCKEWEKRYFDAVEAHKAETEQLRILISQVATQACSREKGSDPETLCRKAERYRRKGGSIMARIEQDQKLLDQINEYLFTMSNDDLRAVLELIEDYLAQDQE